MESRVLSWKSFDWTVRVLGARPQNFSGVGAFARLGANVGFEIYRMSVGSVDTVIYFQFAENGAWVLPIKTQLPMRVHFVEVGIPFHVDQSLQFCISRSVPITEQEVLSQVLRPEKAGKNPNSLYLKNGLLKGPAEKRRLVVPTGLSLIGSSPNCNLRLVHRSIVGTHALLFRCPTSEEVRVVDLGRCPHTELGNNVPLGELIMEGMSLKVGKLDLEAIREPANLDANSATKAIQTGDCVVRSIDAVFLESFDDSPVPKFTQKLPTPQIKDVTHLVLRLDSLERELRGLNSNSSQDPQAALQSVRSDVNKCMRSIDELNEKLALLISRQELILANIQNAGSEHSSAKNSSLALESPEISDSPASPRTVSNEIPNGTFVFTKQMPSPQRETVKAVESNDRESLVLGKFVELRSQDDVRHRGRLAFVIIAVSLLLAASLPTIWYCVPIGWRVRIINDISSVNQPIKP
jgi:hypothetical protein